MTVRLVLTPSEVTDRQVAVLAAVVEAGCYAEAGHRLGIRVSTVRNHLVEVRQRLAVETTMQAVYVLTARGQLVCPTVGRRGLVHTAI